MRIFYLVDLSNIYSDNAARSMRRAITSFHSTYKNSKLEIERCQKSSSAASKCQNKTKAATLQLVTPACGLIA